MAAIQHAVYDSPLPDTPIAYTPRGLAAVINHGMNPNGSPIPLSERTIRHWCERQLLPGAKKIGGRWIISRSALDTLLSQDKGGLSW